MFDTLLLASTFAALMAGLAAGAIGVVLGAVADDALTRRAAAAAAAADPPPGAPVSGSPMA